MKVKGGLKPLLSSFFLHFINLFIKIIKNNENEGGIMATKFKQVPKLKGKSHHVFAGSFQEPMISYDETNTPCSLQIKGLGLKCAQAHQIKMEVDKTIRLFNYKKK